METRVRIYVTDTVMVVAGSEVLHITSLSIMENMGKSGELAIAKEQFSCRVDFRAKRLDISSFHTIIMIFPSSRVPPAPPCEPGPESDSIHPARHPSPNDVERSAISPSSKFTSLRYHEHVEIGACPPAIIL
jgi:hypothetical protein